AVAVAKRLLLPSEGSLEPDVPRRKEVFIHTDYNSFRKSENKQTNGCNIVKEEIPIHNLNVPDWYLEECEQESGIFSFNRNLLLLPAGDALEGTVAIASAQLQQIMPGSIAFSNAALFRADGVHLSDEGFRALLQGV
ncbi:Ribonuclease H, partial [Podarcis lilfordi]